MPFVQADIDAAKAAYATGAQAVRTADGRTVTYRTAADFAELVRMMERDIQRAADPAVSSFVRVGTARGIQ